MNARLRTGRLPIVATAYAAMLVGTWCWWTLQSSATRTAALAASSTDLAHLQHVPWLVLPASALWSGNPIGYWVVVVVCCLGALELVRGPVRTLVTGGVAHVLGTLVSQGVVAIRIATGEMSGSARHLLDFGPSYVVAACAAGVVVSSPAPRWVRVACALTLLPLAIEAFDLTDASQVAATGHAVAVLVGAAMAMAGTRRRGVDTVPLVPQR